METDEKRAALVAFLTEIGANRTDHSGRCLADHLIGTYDMLKKWGCDEPIAMAGGLHSIYGTNIFKVESLNAEARPMVSARFGKHAERLAWLFGSLNRPKAIELGYGIDRRLNTGVALNETDLKALRLIEAANFLEQGISLEKLPNILNAIARHFELI